MAQYCKKIQRAVLHLTETKIINHIKMICHIVGLAESKGYEN